MISIYRIKILFILFMFYSLIGWIIEVFDQLYRQKKFINRGFLIGPYCPVHGVGALLMLLLLKRFSNNILLLFMISILICTILEYLTSFLLEKFFKARWWDYSDYKFNLNGRVCLQNSLFFGLAGVTIVKFANPMLMNLLISIEPNIINIIFFSLFIIFAIDLLVSFKVIFNFKMATDNLTKDSTEEISNKVKKVLSEKSILFRRLINAFPNLRRGVTKLKDNLVSFIGYVIK